MKFSSFGRLALALFASLALGLGMSACGGGTIGYMWVPGAQFNQIVGFKIDDYTGNLTQVPGTPISSQGTSPNMLLVKSGGRYVYVLNQGTLPASCTSAATCATPWTGSGIAVFSVGGNGSLTYLESYHSQGFGPVWMQFSSGDNYLYVLDKYSPGPPGPTGAPTANTDGKGSITVFSVDPTTGRLELVVDTQSIPPGGTAPTFWEVGADPLMMSSQGGCLFTVNSSDQSITPYSEAGNQLVNVTTGKITTGANRITSINGNGQIVVLTDAGANSVMLYGISGCNLSPTDGGVTPLGSGKAFEGTVDPTYSFIDHTGQHLYILNQQNTNTGTNQSYSLITGLQIQNDGLSPLEGSPYQVQAAPVCVAEDPTNRFLYISNRDPGSVTGKKLDPTTGTLSELVHGSNFAATGLAGCLAISANVD